MRVARLRDRLATLHVQGLEATRKVEAATDTLLVALDEATAMGREMYRASADLGQPRRRYLLDDVLEAFLELAPIW